MKKIDMTDYVPTRVGGIELEGNWGDTGLTLDLTDLTEEEIELLIEYIASKDKKLKKD